ncbi:ATP-binding protein [Roseateles sp. PN1]|uniref:ATP-binding protein n=1 Tax=Roseateles sp. PN1 TaxID=3137372 RepID=UPI00313A37D1
MSLARQLTVQIGAVIVLLLLCLALIAQLSIARLTSAQVPSILMRNVVLRATQQGQLFAQAQASVARLHAAWLERAEALPPAQAERRFAELFERSADGVWRVKPALVDAKRRPTFYLQNGQGLSADERLRAVVSHDLLAEQGPALVPPFFSAYVDFVEKGLMVYSNGIDWGASATPATDNFDYPTMQGSDPKRNPRREQFWTPVYFDAEAKTWMVSVIAPLDWRGRWVGTVGHDISVDTLLNVPQDVENGSKAIILSRDGYLIAHPDLRERIAQANGQLALAQLKDPVLDMAYAMIRAHAQSQGAVADTSQGLAMQSPDGGHWVAWAPIAGPNWWSVTLLEKARLDQRVRGAAYWILAFSLLALGLTLWMVRRVIRRLVKQPLGRLTGAVDTLAEQLAQDREIEPMVAGSSSDLRRLSSAFDALGAQLLARQRETQSQAQALQHEVTERRQAEGEVRQLNATLEDRVKQRTAALLQAQDELVRKETLAGLGSLVAGVAHELNTPIGNGLMAVDTARTAVGAALTQLQEQAQGLPLRRSALLANLQTVEQGLDLALGNLSRSASLVQDFKQVSVDRASLQRRLFDLKLVCDEVLHLLPYTLNARPQGKSLHSRGVLRVEVPADVQLDSYPGAFGQVLGNLVENAFVHGLANCQSESGGEVLIRLESLGSDQIVLSVSDNGGGIPPAHQSQVFKPFFTTKLGEGGSGLGLHLVHTLVSNVLGGSIELRSTPGQGTVFTLTLPRRAPQA